jgi:Ni/Fe-hydrogenase subunit HybB-like protein
LAEGGAVKRFFHYYRLTLWDTIFTLFILAGLNAMYLRRVEGWGSQTSLKELFPWGLCAGLDVFCGLALAVGGFSVAATLYVLKLENYRPILRASIVIAFLGFLVALLATIANRPLRLTALATLWGPHSILLGAAVSSIIYTTLLVLEFAPGSSKRFATVAASPRLRFLTVVVAVLAAFVSALQQSSLTKLLAIAPQRFSPLWLTPMLPTLLLLSSVCACLAIIVFASWHTNLAFGRGLPPAVLVEIGKALGIILSFYLGVRFLELLDLRVLPLLFENHLHNYLLGLELSLFLLPVALLIRRRNGATPRLIYWCSVLVIAGFIANRLNTSITAREAVVGVLYVPRWTDFMIAYSIIALGIALFACAARRLPVFPANYQSPRTESSVGTC